MSRTYKVTGINLKSMPMGEADRLLTILTREEGLIRAIAMGSRKHNSSLGGRSGLFVVNELLIARGRSLDKIAQAETLESYPGLSQDLRKLTASQYLAELCLCQALSDQPQEELFCLLNGHLKRLERSPGSLVLPHLTHAVFQLLILSGVAPQVHLCCATRQPLMPNFTDSAWRIGFSIPTGGVVTLEVLARLQAKKRPQQSHLINDEKGGASALDQSAPDQVQGRVAEAGMGTRSYQSAANLNTQLAAADLALLQQLAQAELPDSVEMRKYGDSVLTKADKQSPACDSALPQPGGVPDTFNRDVSFPAQVWCSVERVLRYYAQYHFDRPIRSAALIDACFASAD
ncbi:MAG: DNA repair protein RecO [Kovacikia sp.]